ncbi:MAG: TIGR04282 family arsenosugar biosynthesis glycosyltransferase [Methylococcales bacterium]|nr:TIGR04282 family arsenosugar biosynthesis glycosyltransferase [Methylococcales bacterium]
MSGAIVVFVKTPGFSSVKTRLAVKLGQEKAEAFHVASSRAVSSVIQVLSQSDDVKSYYAVAEEQALTHKYWEDLPCVWQGEGGLGERMAHIYQTLLVKHDFVILVGADIPQMTTEELLKASAWLSHEEQGRIAFAPSIDGGFWLFGGNIQVSQSIWTGVIYSEADTGAQFLKKVKQIGDVNTLASLRDVDEVEDLVMLKKTLLDLSDPLPEQQELMRFLDTLPLSKVG